MPRTGASAPARPGARSRVNPAPSAGRTTAAGGGLLLSGLGWLVLRERSDLPEDLVFYENYLGQRDATFTLNFSTGARMVLAQYYNFIR